MQENVRSHKTYEQLNFIPVTDSEAKNDLKKDAELRHKNGKMIFDLTLLLGKFYYYAY